MPAATRIYSVSTPAGTRLVEAPNKSQAINHVARDTITAEVAPQQKLVSLVSEGVKVEIANAE
jgi:hypothetical protein